MAAAKGTSDMMTVIVEQDGRTRQADRLDPAWIAADSGVNLWVDLTDPTPDDAAILREVFRFHELAVEDATSAVQYPKAETYAGCLFLILHGIDFQASQHRLATHDYDFFLGPTYLVTVHDAASRSIPEVVSICLRNDRAFAEGPTAILHRIIDAMVDHYRPEVDKLEEKLDEIEDSIFKNADALDTTRRILELKRDVASLRRVILPQRDVVGRLARREFQAISEEMSYRFRDVHDHVIRVADEATLFHDRVTSLLEAHLSNTSNRLNEVMKVLTIIATMFMPLGVLTGMYGMNVPLIHFPGGEGVQFWWILGIMVANCGLMLWFFRRKRWI
jgi:magnesium transporter